MDKINGVMIKDLADVETALKSPKKGIHTIQVQEFPHLIHVDAAAMERDNTALLGGAFRVGALQRLQ